jgi:TonB family protein
MTLSSTLSSTRSSLFLLCGCTLLAPSAGLSADHAEPGIVETVNPVFPPELDASGFNYGEVHILIKVDAAGKLADYLVTAYTRQPFADSAVAALQHWTFEPAQIDGRATGWMREIEIKFQTQGGRIVSDNLDHPAGKLSLLNDREDKLVYRAYALRELDRIPVPLQAVSPPGHPASRVVISFYIDQRGRVRLPEIQDGSRQFAPPTRKGVPVLVRARQVFVPEVKP